MGIRRRLIQPWLFCAVIVEDDVSHLIYGVVEIL